MKITLLLALVCASCSKQPEIGTPIGVYGTNFIEVQSTNEWRRGDITAWQETTNHIFNYTDITVTTNDYEFNNTLEGAVSSNLNCWFTYQLTISAIAENCTNVVMIGEGFSISNKSNVAIIQDRYGVVHEIEIATNLVQRILNP